MIATLLEHTGSSRLILTARRLPADLKDHPRLQREAIHALSFAESVLLARELPHLGGLFGSERDRELLVRTLRLVQGHPKLLELADGLAADREALERQVAAGEAQAGGREAVLDAFFAVTGQINEGETRQGEADFVVTLHRWTDEVAAGLAPIPRLLLQFLARLEPADRTLDVVEANWKDFLARIKAQAPTAAEALALPDQGLAEARDALARAGLVEVAAPTLDPTIIEQVEALLAGQEQTADFDLQAILAAIQSRSTTLTVHPGVAEAVRAQADPKILAAADTELGDYHIAMAQHGLETEQAGGGGTVVTAGRRGAPYLLRQKRWDAASRLLENMIARDQRPETLAFAIPLLRRIVEATQGTDEGLVNAGVLANVLLKMGRHAEAERLLRDGLEAAVARGNYRLASKAANDMLILLRTTGRLVEALALAEEKASYIRAAGLGPWTQLSDETQRLQVLAAMGRYLEVLERVAAVRPQMQALPEQSDAKETVTPWTARETLLDTGRSAAMLSEQWEQALDLNAAILKSVEDRDGGDLQLARRRFNDYGPLLRLERYRACGELLQDCRVVFEREHDIQGLGAVYSALADLQDKTHDREAAVGFEQVALRFSYQAGQPEDCAISHHNLANYLERAQADPDQTLAHRLTAATIYVQIGSGGLLGTLRALANATLPAEPPGFDRIADRVEQVEGVRFRELFAALPPTYPDGDAAIAAVWQQVQTEQQRGEPDAAARQAALETLPPELTAALAGGDEGAIEKAFAALSPEEQTAAMETLREAGLLPDESSGAPSEGELLQEWESLLQAIAAVAQGDDEQRAAIEEALAEVEKNGWMLREPVARIWAGERDAETLTAGLDEQDAALVRSVLDRL